MATIGGKSRKSKTPNKPQFVIQRAAGLNEYAQIGMDDKANMTLTWVGDPNAVSKYDSRYDAKLRTRHIEEIPETRMFTLVKA